ncbi:MAG TPA: hypothetical protein VGQ93_08115 [Lysobacter sp.]|nr:hypothetical protein [Lysobacter sp.]
MLTDVIPAKAGLSIAKLVIQLLLLVIPAKAGIHFDFASKLQSKDTGFPPSRE